MKTYHLKSIISSIQNKGTIIVQQSTIARIVRQIIATLFLICFSVFGIKAESRFSQNNKGLLQNGPKKSRSSNPERGWLLRLFALEYCCETNRKALRA
jgi:hypothetical protein